MGDFESRCAWVAAASEGVGVSVGDSSAASIDVGVVLLFCKDGDQGFEAGCGVGLGAGFCWLDAEVRRTLGAGTPLRGAAEFSAVALVLLSLLRRLE